MTFDDQRFAYMRLGNDQIVDVEIMIVFSIRDCRLQAFAHIGRDALARAGNNKSKAARLLGLTRAQLRSRIEKHGLPAES